MLVPCAVGWLGCDAASGTGDTGGDDVDATDGSLCGPDNCEGCCDPAGVCRLGLDGTRCGHGGAACDDCAAGGGRCESGTCIAPGCGDGIIGGAEQCDGSELGGATCATLAFAAGTVTCGADCRFDTSGCAALSCEVAAADPDHLPCDFCSADGTALMYCGFCRELPTGGHPPDQRSPCDAGETCYSWSNGIDDRTEFGCLDAPPEPCPADWTDGRCEGDLAVNCTQGRLDRFDCTTLGQSCAMTTNSTGVPFPTCIEPGAESCIPDAYDESCEGDVRLICSYLTYFEVHEACAAGTTCVDAGRRALCLDDGWVPCDPATFVPSCDGSAVVECAPLDPDSPAGGGVETAEPCDPVHTCGVTAFGAQCVQLGTAACDPSAYVTHCAGDHVMVCGTYMLWEGYTDCDTLGEPGLMTCHEFASGPACAPRGYTPCDPATERLHCEGTVARSCHSPGWLELHSCAGLNPVCVEGEYVADCSFTGAAPCSFDMARSQYEVDRYGVMERYRPLRCLDGGTLVVCDEYLQVEMLRGCDVGRRCLEDPEYYPHLDATCT